ncbi:MAG: TRAP transporter substrate-binding protein [Betaproteobacteria bacterium]|nr:MAG: TRAP transporter substrate-binding protein [Betaproteobacteria bacterium]
MKRLRPALLGITVGAIGMAAWAAGAQAQQITLKLHHLLPAVAPAHTKMLAPWAQDVEKASGGKVKIELYPNMTLGGKPPELINQVRDGVVDIVWTVNGYTPNLFPRSEVFELPFIHTNNATATNLAMRDMFLSGEIAEDFKDVQVMFLHVHAGQGIQMAEKEVRKPDDLKGLKMRIPTRTGAWIIEALGAAPAAMPVPALPQALQKKVVDGALIPWEIIPPLKLQDVTKVQVEGPQRERFGTTTFQVSMNKNTWAKLPPDVKQAFEANNGEARWRAVGKVWTDSEEGGIAMAKKAGNKHIQITAAELELFKQKLEPVVQRWIDEVKSKGIDGKALVARARELVAKYSK